MPKVRGVLHLLILWSVTDHADIWLWLWNLSCVKIKIIHNSLRVNPQTNWDIPRTWTELRLWPSLNADSNLYFVFRIFTSQILGQWYPSVLHSTSRTIFCQISTTPCMEVPTELLPEEATWIYVFKLPWYLSQVLALSVTSKGFQTKRISMKCKK